MLHKYETNDCFFIAGFDRTIVYEILSLILVTRRWVRRKKEYFNYYDFKANFRPVKVEVLIFHCFLLSDAQLVRHATIKIK